MTHAVQQFLEKSKLGAYGADAHAIVADEDHAR